MTATFRVLSLIVLYVVLSPAIAFPNGRDTLVSHTRARADFACREHIVTDMRGAISRQRSLDRLPESGFYRLLADYATDRADGDVFTKGVPTPWHAASLLGPIGLKRTIIRRTQRRRPGVQVPAIEVWRDVGSPDVLPIGFGFHVFGENQAVARRGMYVGQFPGSLNALGFRLLVDGAMRGYERSLRVVRFRAAITGPTIAFDRLICPTDNLEQLSTGLRSFVGALRTYEPTRVTDDLVLQVLRDSGLD